MKHESTIAYLVQGRNEGLEHPPAHTLFITITPIFTITIIIIFLIEHCKQHRESEGQAGRQDGYCLH